MAKLMVIETYTVTRYVSVGSAEGGQVRAVEISLPKLKWMDGYEPPTHGPTGRIGGRTRMYDPTGPDQLKGRRR